MFGSRSRRIRSRIAPNNRFGTATSAIWKTTYRECATTFAPILMSFSRNVVSDQCFTAGGRASRRRKLPRLYASTNSCGRTDPKYGPFVDNTDVFRVMAALTPQADLAHTRAEPPKADDKSPDRRVRIRTLSPGGQSAR